MKNRYVLHPGKIISIHDGQTHYINPPQLAMLYGVNMRECIVDNGEMGEAANYGEFIHLYPRANGDYRLD